MEGARMKVYFICLAILMACFVSIPFAEEKEGEGLMEAIEEGNLHEVRELVEEGEKINVVDVEEGVTPLIQAITFGKVDIVKFLLKSGADVNLPDESNAATPLMWGAILDPGKEARERGIPIPPLASKVEIVRALLASGAKVNIKNHWGGTALQWAADAGLPEMIKMLLQAGAEVNSGDDEGLTPLMAAANYETSDHANIVRLLLAAKADVHQKNKMGDTALMYAINNFKTENVQTLLKAGAEVNQRNSLGFTPLMKAGQLARLEIMSALIAAGADLQTKNSEGNSVLGVAIRAGYKDSIQLLRDAGAKE